MRRNQARTSTCIRALGASGIAAFALTACTGGFAEPQIGGSTGDDGVHLVSTVGGSSGVRNVIDDRSVDAILTVRNLYTGTPVAQATLRITGLRDALQGRTNAEGVFRATAIAPGRYTVAITAEGYFAQTELAVNMVAGASHAEFEVYATNPTEEQVAAHLQLLERERVVRDDPDDPALRPEIAALLRLEHARPDREAALPDGHDSDNPLHNIPHYEGASACSPLGAVPATIRVWRRSMALSDTETSCTGRVDVIPFESYIQGVLPREWVPSWNRESVRAGAIAVRTYSWRAVRSGGRYPCADVDDTSNSQVYRDTRVDSTDRAVEATRGLAIMRTATRVLASGEYSAENGDPTATGVADPLCAGLAVNGHGRGMCQRGSNRWAGSGRDNLWIATHYFADSEVVRGDIDTDGDGLVDCHDDCPAVANPSQADSDRDGIGDACDSDLVGGQDGGTDAAPDRDDPGRDAMAADDVMTIRGDATDGEPDDGTVATRTDVTDSGMNPGVNAAGCACRSVPAGGASGTGWPLGLLIIALGARPRTSVRRLKR